MKNSFVLLSTFGGIVTLLAAFFLTPITFNLLDGIIILAGSVLSASVARYVSVTLRNIHHHENAFLEYLFFSSVHWTIFGIICLLTSTQMEGQTSFIIVRVLVSAFLLICIFWYIEFRWRQEIEERTFLEKEKNASG